MGKKVLITGGVPIQPYKGSNRGPKAVISNSGTPTLASFTLVCSVCNLLQVWPHFGLVNVHFAPWGFFWRPCRACQGISRHHNTTGMGYRVTHLKDTHLWNCKFATFLTSPPPFPPFFLANVNFSAWGYPWRSHRTYIRYKEAHMTA